MHRSVYMVEWAIWPDRYREESAARTLALLDGGAIRLAGADGDEETNTVTYWYKRNNRSE
jgi:hypothetical protein